MPGHPSRVAEFKNETGGPLEPGLMAVFDDHAFLGQTVIDETRAGGAVDIPFATETGISISRDESLPSGGSAPRVWQIESGTLTIEQQSRRVARYVLASDLEQDSTVLLEHRRAANARVVSAPAGADTTTGSINVPCKVPAHGSATVVVEESAPVREYIDWRTKVADEALAHFIADPDQSADAVHEVQAIAEARKALAAATDERDSLRQQAYTATTDGIGDTAQLTARLRASEKKLADEVLHFEAVAKNVHILAKTAP